MDDCRKAIRHLADAVRLLMEAQGDNLGADARFIVSDLLRSAGMAIGDQNVASDATPEETDPPE